MVRDKQSIYWYGRVQGAWLVLWLPTTILLLWGLKLTGTAERFRIVRCSWGLRLAGVAESLRRILTSAVVSRFWSKVVSESCVWVCYDLMEGYRSVALPGWQWSYARINSDDVATTASLGSFCARLGLLSVVMHAAQFCLLVSGSRGFWSGTMPIALTYVFVTLRVNQGQAGTPFKNPCCGGAYVISNQNPRWTQKPCIPLCWHTIFDPDYYVYTPYLVLITMFTQHIWF